MSLKDINVISQLTAFRRAIKRRNLLRSEIVRFFIRNRQYNDACCLLYFDAGACLLLNPLVRPILSLLVLLLIYIAMLLPLPLLLLFSNVAVVVTDVFGRTCYKEALSMQP